MILNKQEDLKENSTTCIQILGSATLSNFFNCCDLNLRWKNQRNFHLKTMKIRKSLMPKSKQDAACSFFLFLIIPVIFYYEVQVSTYINNFYQRNILVIF